VVARELEGGTLVIAPPALLDRNNPGSWLNVFGDFGVRQIQFESVGKLDDLLSRATSRYANVFIDESQRPTPGSRSKDSGLMPASRVLSP
jgi:hypothetical protein